MSKKYEIVNGDMSDGSHTFDELYVHRNLLWVNLCLTNPESCYFVKEHYPDWDLLVYEYVGMQMSYHIQKIHRNVYQNLIKVKKIEDHEFDGHSPEDVIARLTKLAIERNQNHGKLVRDEEGE